VDGPVLVTGANGFIGKHLVRLVSESNREVVAVQGDLRRPDIAAAAVAKAQPSAVVHLATSAGSLNAWNALAQDVAMAGNVIRALSCHSPDALLLVPGSAAQYGWGSAEYLAEDSPRVPVSGYGAMKCVLEDALFLPPLSGRVRVIWARTFNVLGPGQPLRAPVASWATQLASTKRAGRAHVRVGNLAAIRDFLDVRDVAEAYIALLGSDFDGPVNVGSGVAVELRQILDDLMEHFQVQATVDVRPELMHDADPPKIVADVSLLRRHTRWSPRRDLSSSLADIATAAGSATEGI
jgi:GDP-4-dehydro-6-deoxy-D-mannose reductase